MQSSFKAVCLGEGRVGKTSIALKWVKGNFDASQKSTVRAGLWQKSVETSKGVIELCLWDTAGQEMYRAVTPIYYKDANAALLVYDVTNQTSFDRVKQWHLELTQIREDQTFIVVVANKIDMANKRVISPNEGVAYAQSIGCNHFEVSAKTGEGIDMLFRYIAENLAKRAPTKKARVKPKHAIQIIQQEETNPQGPVNPDLGSNNDGCSC